MLYSCTRMATVGVKGLNNIAYYLSAVLARSLTCAYSGSKPSQYHNESESPDYHNGLASWEIVVERLWTVVAGQFRCGLLLPTTLPATEPRKSASYLACVRTESTPPE